MFPWDGSPIYVAFNRGVKEIAGEPFAGEDLTVGAGVCVVCVTWDLNNSHCY